MGNSLRNQPMPSLFETLKTPVREDALQVGLLYAFGIIGFSFLAIVPGIRGWERLWACIRVFTALWIGAVLLVCNYGSWYSDSICTTTQYKAHTKPNSQQLIQATVGISIYLRGINVTLREMENGCGSEIYERPFPKEKINYVETFHWDQNWRQGRMDFGEFGGQFRQRFRVAQYRGMPYPILWVAEKFLFDGDQFIWYRKFRIAGWYTHILLWLGFAIYLLSILLFIVSIQSGAYFMFLTGAMLCLAALTFSIVIQNDPPLQVHFPDAILRPKFNYSFYLTAATGVMTCILACIVLVMQNLYPRKVALFFHHTLLEDDAIYEGILEEEEPENLDYKERNKIDTHRRKLHEEREITEDASAKRKIGTHQKSEGIKEKFSHLHESVRSKKRDSTRNNRRSDIYLRKKSATLLSQNPTEAEDDKTVEMEHVTAAEKPRLPPKLSEITVEVEMVPIRKVPIYV